MKRQFNLNMSPILPANKSSTSKHTYITFFSTVITQQLMKWTQLGAEQYGFVYAMVTETLDNIDFSSFTKLDLTQYLPDIDPHDIPDEVYLLFAVFSSIAILVYLYFNLLVPLFQVTLKFTDTEKTTFLINYIKKHPERFSQIRHNREIDVHYVGLWLIPELNNWIKIKDDQFELQGKLRFSTQDNSSSNTTITTEIIAQKQSSFEINEYLEQISEYMSNNRDLAVKKYHVKILLDENNQIYTDTQLITYDGDRKFLVESFFHPERDLMWSMLNGVEQNAAMFRKFGQSPRVGMILHGAPGVGKSTFIFRTAMRLNRHIVSLKLDDIRTTKRLIQIIKQPVVNSKTMTHRDVVFVLDEFDLSLDRLEKLQKSKEVLMQDRGCQIGGAADGSCDHLAKNVSNPANTMGVITKRDLLELFQGAVPMEGLIIIATTNSLEKIEQYSAALVRPGRMTPFLFEYGNLKMFIQMIKFYFNKELDEDDVIRLFGVDKDFRFQQSELIDLSMQCKLMFADDERAWREFCSYFKKTCHSVHTQSINCQISSPSGGTHSSGTHSSGTPTANLGPLPSNIAGNGQSIDTQFLDALQTGIC